MTEEHKNGDTEKYPLDFDALKKGDIISAERCEAILRMNRDQTGYALKLLGLKEEIERELGCRGPAPTLRCHKDAIEILVDAEASPYNEQQERIAVRKLVRAQYRNCAVDVANLTDEEKSEHNRRLIVGGAMVSAVRKARRVALNEVKRDRPLLGNDGVK